jgi:2-polyprenyl-6-methoxyphenol hydroxylase-like FAD-dependent oxidoreductase
VVSTAGIDTRGLEILDERGTRLGFADQSDHAPVFGAPSVTIERGKLLALLVAACERAAVELRFETRLGKIEGRADRVDICTLDGQRLELDWLAACDGIRSETRKHVFPEYAEPHFTSTITAFREFETLRRPRVEEVAKLAARNRSQKRAMTWLDRLLRRVILPLVLPAGIKSARRLFAYRVDTRAHENLSAPVGKAADRPSLGQIGSLDHRKSQRRASWHN